jgi:hypothetical protein
VGQNELTTVVGFRERESKTGHAGNFTASLFEQL